MELGQASVGHDDSAYNQEAHEVLGQVQEAVNRLLNELGLTFISRMTELYIINRSGKNSLELIDLVNSI
jgi:hypothetical protein